MTVSIAQLVRTFALQEQPRHMLFLGAGASVGAGIPTAAEMVWIFKRDIYCSETNTNPEALRDLTVARNQDILQAYFDDKPGFPHRGADNEYSFYFEQFLPDYRDRRAFIRRQVARGVPTIGHECLGALLAAGRIDWVWTTNFDDLVERSERSDTERRLLQIGPESRERLDVVVEEDLTPVLIKLHGDYRYDRLQNTDEELQALDENLRQHLANISRGKGLILAGYSGRDESVMSALESAALSGGFDKGLYWCVLSSTPPNERVKALVEQVKEEWGRGGFVEIDGFDDLMYRFYRQSELDDPEIEAKAEELFDQRQPFDLTITREVRAPLKLSAIKVLEYPTSPYRFATTIGSWRELRETIDGAPIVAGLHRGVLAFGNRERIRAVFGDKIVGSIQVADVKPEDLRLQDTVTKGLFYDMIGRSLVADYGLRSADRYTFYVPVSLRAEANRSLQFEHRGIEFNIPFLIRRGSVYANEAFSYHLDFYDETLWLVLEPRVAVTRDGTELAGYEQRRAVANRVLSERYNEAVHSRLLFWLHYLKSVADPITFRFPPHENMSASIILDSNYAFSSRYERD